MSKPKVERRRNKHIIRFYEDEWKVCCRLNDSAGRWTRIARHALVEAGVENWRSA